MASLAPHLIRFITTSINSVPLLEALLLLHADADFPWNARLIAMRLYIGERESASLLEQLVEAGIARRDPDGCRYAPSGPELAVLIDELDVAYKHQLVAVTRLIHSATEWNATRFSSAFRLRKD